MNERERQAYRLLHEQGETAVAARYGDRFLTHLLNRWEDTKRIRIVRTPDGGYVIRTFKKYL